MVFMSTSFYIGDFFKFIFVAPVFEIEYCAFEDVGKTSWIFIVENLIKIGPSYSKILGAEPDL